MESKRMGWVGWWIILLAVLGACDTASDLLHAEDPSSFPSIFTADPGDDLAHSKRWERRREQLRNTLLHWQYGRMPPAPREFEVRDARSQHVHFKKYDLWGVLHTATLVCGPKQTIKMPVGFWRPRDADEPSPAILAMEPVWWPDPFQRWEIVPRVLKRGYVLAGFDHNALASYEDSAVHPAQDGYPEFDWGVVAVGAWGYRLAMNYLESQDLHVNSQRVSIWGHSRRGKSCLLAGAVDERFASVAPHMSGMGGDALYRVRGKGAQQLEQLLERYWLHPRIFEFIDREDELPFDQHWLLALVAPRLLYLHIGKDDRWGNPSGALASYAAALPVYQRLGKPQHLGVFVGDYDHHDPNGATGWDSWETHLQWLDWHWKGIPPRKRFQSPK
jgi:hypothetical protein